MRKGCDGTGWVPDDGAPLDDLADERDAADDEGAVAELDAAPLDDAPPRGPAPVPLPEICDAQAAPSAAHAATATAGRIRKARTLAYPAYAFALTSVTFIVFPLGVSYATVSPSRAPVSALPSGEAAE